MANPRRKVAKEMPSRGPADAAAGGISLVFPVHNESFIIEQTLRNYIAELEKRVPDFEVIVSEDGSTDDTKSILERLAEELPIKLFMNNERKGYQQGVIDAITHATKPWLFVVDSDYQFAAIDFWRLEPYRKEYDVILGVKAPRRDDLPDDVLPSWKIRQRRAEIVEAAKAGDHEPLLNAVEDMFECVQRIKFRAYTSGDVVEQLQTDVAVLMAWKENETHRDDIIKAVEADRARRASLVKIVSLGIALAGVLTSIVSVAWDVIFGG